MENRNERMTDRMNRTEYVHVMKGMAISSRHQVASDGCMAEASWVAILEKTGTEAISRHVNMFKFFSLSKLSTDRSKGSVCSPLKRSKRSNGDAFKGGDDLWDGVAVKKKFYDRVVVFRD